MAGADNSDIHNNPQTYDENDTGDTLKDWRLALTGIILLASALVAATIVNAENLPKWAVPVAMLIGSVVVAASSVVLVEGLPLLEKSTADNHTPSEQ